ncbi:MAG TPA: hypothetical protein VF763_02225 [Candidatus Limnocylindrales bacterium]
MSHDRRADCQAHQAALLDFVDRRASGPGVEVALRHLERCGACEEDLAATASVIAALHRLWAETQAVEPPTDAWPRLRERVARQAVRRWQPGTLSGLVAGAGLVLALIVPSGLSLAPQGDLSDADAAASPTSLVHATAPSLLARLPANMDRRGLAGEASTGASIDTADASLSIPWMASAGGSVPIRYPDNLRPPAAAPRPVTDSQRSGPPIQAR